MPVKVYGAIQVVTAGTPVRVTANAQQVHAMYFQAHEKNTQMCYVGRSTTGSQGDLRISQAENPAGLVAQIAAPSGGAAASQDRTTLPDWGFGNAAQQNTDDAANFWIDAEVDGERVIVTAVVG